MESILANAKARHADGGQTMIPCRNWYNHVLGAWARSDNAAAASRRTRVMLSGMEACANSGSRGGGGAAPGRRQGRRHPPAGGGAVPSRRS